MTTTAAASPLLSHRRTTRFDRFWFGAAYYPEHWDQPTRAADPARMAEAGFNIVRLAEFAWDLIEPQEGQFEFSLFDQTIERLGRQGIHSLLSTPTAAPPRWLTVAHPAIVRVNEDGVALEHGSRQHACHANPTFREYSRRITRALAEHYRHNPFVVGWQTDNEFHCHFSECHCAACQAAFAEFVRRKFAGDIAALNRAWGTGFWAQTYRSFTEIPTPRPRRPSFLNPAHQLDYRRYLSDAVTAFQHDQIEILRAAQPRWWITHNGVFGNLDYRGAFTRDLDVLGYDCYPMFCTTPAARPATHAFGLDMARAWSGNFIVPEQQSGPGGQPPYFHDHPEPGELRKLTYVSIARGADSLLYFRWRTARFGAEEYWCGILDHDNIPRRRYQEVCRVGRELKTLGPALLGTHVRVDVACAAADVDVNNAHQTYSLGLPDHEAVAAGIHRQFYRRGYAVGGIHPADDLGGVKLYFIPHWAVFQPDWVKPLERFVRQGGVLVIGARTATRDWNNNVVPESLPGCLRELCGVTVTEYGRQNAPDERPLAFAVAGKKVTAMLWYETLALQAGSRAAATWTTRHLKGQPAISVRQLGNGSVWYVGTYLTDPVVTALLPGWIKQAGLQPLWPRTPAGVEVVVRENADQQLWFFINHNARVVALRNPPRVPELLTGKKPGSSLRLAAYDVAIFRMARKV